MSKAKRATASGRAKKGSKAKKADLVSQAKPGTGSERKEKSDEDSKAEKADFVVVREGITDEVGGAALEMVKGSIDAAKKGHYPAMKCLFEMVGLYPASVPEQALLEDSLAKTLLRRLNLPEEPRLQTKVTEAFCSDGEEPATDTVE